MGDNHERLREDLEKLYCPPLDSALLTAIVFDYDLADRDQVRQLRETLDALKASALEQEDLPFDPSGTSGLADTAGAFDTDGIPSEPSTSQNDTWRSRETDMTSLESDLSSLGIDQKGFQRSVSRSTSNGAAGLVVGANGSLGLSGSGLDEKTVYLSEMFPSVDIFTIKHTLKKCDEDVDRSMDVLLNLAFFQDQGPSDDGTKVSIPKGIDGFAEQPNGGSGKRKGKNRKNKTRELLRQSECNSSYSSQEDVAAVNKWDASKKDVEFIYSRTSSVLQREVVASAYHSNGASLPATIRSLATSYAPKDERQIFDHPVMAAQVAELGQEFSTTPNTTLAGLLNITRNSISAANELAAAMLRQPSSTPLSELIKITTTPPIVDTEVDKPQSPKPSTRVVREYGSAREAASSHLMAGAEAFSKASAAYRRGKSDKLMGGAAAYYSAIGRDHIEKAKREVAAAADALVDSQSTSDLLDLHGVSVQDAVRIASQRVSQWWESLGDAKYRPGGGGPARRGYRIVTGVGRHSHDGTSRIGPAVAKMLAREGWRVEVGEGVLTVTGMVRRR
ncbi:hypothetical protein VTN02DRAFT_1011 [Thermoascus thermophilus]